MPLKIIVDTQCGHPWTKQKGWLVMSVHAETVKDLANFIKEKVKNDFWKVWIEDSYSPKAVLYKPEGVSTSWEDIKTG